MQKQLSALLVILLLLASSLAFGQTKVASGTKIASGAKLSTPTAGGPSNFVNDTFTEGSDTTLASHTPELGGTITKHPDSSYSSTITIDAATDEGFPLQTTAYFYNATPPSADYDVDMFMHVVTIENVNFGPCGHMDTSANTMICVRLNNGTSWDLRQIVTGTGTTPGTSSSSLPNAGDTVKVTLRFSSSGTLASVLINDSQVIAPQSISVTSAGKVGMRASGGSSSVTGFHVTSLSAR